MTFRDPHMTAILPLYVALFHIATSYWFEGGFQQTAQVCHFITHSPYSFGLHMTPHDPPVMTQVTHYEIKKYLR